MINNQWNKFILESPAGSFLQSYDWAIFQESLGRKTWRIVVDHQKSKIKNQKSKIHIKNKKIKKEKDWLLTGLVIKYNLPFGKSYLYCPRGPIVDFLKSQGHKPMAVFEKFLREIKKIVEKENAIFFRIDPEWIDSEEMKGFLEKLGFKKSSTEIQPKDTLILNLAKSEKQLLKEMHHKTRYNIRLAHRRGVRAQIRNPKSEIRNKFKIQNSKPQNFEDFWRLLEETARRDKFRPHPKKYYEKMLGIFSESRIKNHELRVNLFTASYKNKIIAANIVMFFGNRATYLHGASSNEYKNVMAPYLLQWQAIKEAKKQGCTEYDFWGISEKKWPGTTRFKKGFGGGEVSYVGAYDLVFDPLWYRFYQVGHFVRNIR